MHRIAIIGLGLMGGSFGMALKRAGINATIVGHDVNFESASKAKRRGAIDRVEWNLPKAVEAADLVVLAVPVGAIKTLLSQIADHLKEGCVVTDVASTKEQVLAWAERALPAGISFIGGHPMAGREVSGIESSTADLLAGCTYCLCPARSAAEEAVEMVTSTVRAIRAHPLFIDPAEHDSYVAAISHLPYLAAVSLVRVSGKSSSWQDMAQLAASGFRDTTRVASSNPGMYRDICGTNRANIARWLEAYIAELRDLREALLEEDEGMLDEMLQEGKQIRDDWLAKKLEAPVANIELPSTASELRQVFWGNLGIGRRKQVKR